MQTLFFYGRFLIMLTGLLLFNACGKHENKIKKPVTHNHDHKNHDDHYKHVTLDMPPAAGHEEEIPHKLPNPEHAQTPMMPEEPAQVITTQDMHISESMGKPHEEVHEFSEPNNNNNDTNYTEKINRSDDRDTTDTKRSHDNTDYKGTRDKITNDKLTGAKIRDNKVIRDTTSDNVSKKSSGDSIDEITGYNTVLSKSIDFEVENTTGKTLYVTCFSYIKRRDFGRWKWEKSDVYRIEDNAHAIIALEKIDDPQDRENVLGYLGVFNSEEKAQESTYELLPEENQIDLDEISKLHGKKVVIMIEKYGIRGEFLDFDFIDKAARDKQTSEEVDFPVENKTGKPLFVTCFVYEKKAKGHWLVAVEDKDDVAIWRYDKTNVIKIMPNEQKIIDVDTISVKRDRDSLEGYLAIFDEDEEQQAQDCVYELLESYRKLNLGILVRLQNKKVVLDIEKYGISGDLIDFTIKPVSKIDFTKILKK